MPDEPRTLHGESQIALMRAVWTTGGGTVEEIRAALPPEYQSSYKTIQTLLSRLAERGLLIRTPGTTARGPTGKIQYRPAISESDYLTESIERTLAEASPDARQAAITALIGRLDADGGKRKKRGK